MKRQISLCVSHLITDSDIYILCYEIILMEVRSGVMLASSTVFLTLNRKKFALVCEILKACQVYENRFQPVGAGSFALG